MQHQLFELLPYAYVRNNPINRFDPDGYVDWWQVGAGALGVFGDIAQAVGGVALMADGFTTTGFGIATMVAGFKDDGTQVPGGILEAVGEQVGGETGKKIGAVGDGLVGAGNPIKNLKNAGKILPTSAKEAKAAVGYQKAVAKEVIQSATTTSSDVHVINNSQEIIETVINDEEDQDKKNGSSNP